MNRNIFFTTVLLLGLTACTEIEVPIIDVIMRQNTAAFAVGEIRTKVATVLPRSATNQSITWKSSNPAVAIVDANGVVTAVSPGIAVITVTTTDGARTATSTISVGSTYDPGVFINGVRWATRNVDRPGMFAPTPESLGSFFQWNSGITEQGWSWEWERENDPCPQGWRIPTRTELHSLSNASHYWNGWRPGFVVGTAPHQIFLPQERSILSSATCYWSNAPNEARVWLLVYFYHNKRFSSESNTNSIAVTRCLIRCVKE